MRKLFSILTLLLALVVPAFAGGSTAPAQIGTVPSLYRRMARPLIVSNRFNLLGGIDTVTTDTGGNGREQLAMKFAGSNMQVIFANVYTTGSAATDYQEATTSLTDVTVTCSIKNITQGWSTAKRVTWGGGNASVTIKPGTRAVSDPMGIDWNNADVFEYTWSWRNPTNGSACVTPAQSSGQLGTSLAGLKDSWELFSTGNNVVDHTMDGGFGSNAGYYTFGGDTGASNDAGNVWKPFAVVGVPNSATQQAWAFIGDSISVGTLWTRGLPSSNPTGVSGAGYVTNGGEMQMIADSYGLPSVTIGASGTQLFYEGSSNFTVRGTMLEYVNGVGVCIGTNDIADYGKSPDGNGWNASTNDYPSMLTKFENALPAFLNRIRSHGINNIVIMGPPPRSLAATTGDGALWVTTNSQSNYESAHDTNSTYITAHTGLATWLASHPASLGSYVYIDMFNPLQTGTGFWSAGPQLLPLTGTNFVTTGNGTTTTTGQITASQINATPYNASDYLSDDVIEWVTLNGSSVSSGSADRYRYIKTYSNGGNITMNSALSVAPIIGDSFKVWTVFTIDGTHPNWHTYSVINAAGYANFPTLFSP